MWTVFKLMLSIDSLLQLDDINMKISMQFEKDVKIQGLGDYQDYQ